MSDRSGALDPRLRKFGSQVRQARESLGLTLEDLAGAAGVSYRQLSRVEGGRASPSLVWMLAVAGGLKLTLSELTRGID